MGGAGLLTSGAGLGELLTERRSVRAFSPRPVERRLLESVFEAARWAPSSRNSQPWEYVVATGDADPEAHAMVASVLGPRNQRYAPRAPVLAISLARTRDVDGSPLPHAWHDSGVALGFLILQARSLGLEVHPMGGFDTSRARSLFEIGDDRDPVAVVALGYAGDPGELPEGLGDRDRAERTRKPLSEVMLIPPRPSP